MWGRASRWIRVLTPLQGQWVTIELVRGGVRLAIIGRVTLDGALVRLSGAGSVSMIPAADIWFITQHGTATQDRLTLNEMQHVVGRKEAEA